MRIVLGTLFLLLIYTVAVVYVYSRLRPPEIKREIKIEYRDRPIQPSDTTSSATPKTRIVYKVERDTVKVKVPMPPNFKFGGMISPTPVRLDSRKVTLTYWAPDSLRFIQDVYVIPRRNWGLYVDAGGECPPCTVDARLNLRYRAVRVFGGYQLNQEGKYQPIAGVRLKLIGWD